MKKVISLLLILFMCFALSACNSSQNAETTETTGYTVSEESNAAKEESSSTQQDENGDTETMKVLVAYFSRTGENYGVGHIEKGNTHIIADMIAEQVDADLFEISTVVPYPDEYEACTETEKQEKEEDARPEQLHSFYFLSNIRPLPQSVQPILPLFPDGQSFRPHPLFQ